MIQVTRDGTDVMEHALLRPEAEYDVIVIGVGPAGLTAAIYTSSLKLRTLMFEGSNPSAEVGAYGEQLPGLS